MPFALSDALLQLSQTSEVGLLTDVAERAWAPDFCAFYALLEVVLALAAM